MEPYQYNGLLVVAILRHTLTIHDCEVERRLPGQRPDAADEKTHVSLSFTVILFAMIACGKKEQIAGL